MRSDPKPDGQVSRPSFIEQARRKQIVDTAIRTIATRGYSRTSLAEIAREAGISKGVISYHFEGKAELIEEILSRLMHEPAEFIKARVDVCERMQDKLRAYIAANFEFARTHRNHLKALVDLWGSRDSTEGRNRFDAEAYAPSRRYLMRIIAEGGSGNGTQTLASVIQAAIDGVLLQWAFDADAIDLEACRDEIQEMVTGHIAARSTASTRENTGS